MHLLIAAPPRFIVFRLATLCVVAFVLCSNVNGQEELPLEPVQPESPSVLDPPDFSQPEESIPERPETSVAEKEEPDAETEEEVTETIAEFSEEMGSRDESIEPIEPSSAEPEQTDRLIQFSFSGTPWRDVVQWIADEGKLALHVGELPTGSFTYNDPSDFTFDQAVDRINLFLLPQGYSLVRSGQLLSVINLADPRGIQQLDAIAELVPVEELASRNNHEVIKCIFPLGELEAEDAVQELGALQLMTTPAVFSKTNQLMITDTAGKLKNAKAILDSFQPSLLENGTIVKSFALQYVDAEDILVVARPHLGLATGEMIGIDVSLSADLQGKNIFVTGVEDKVKLLETLVESIDQPNARLTASDGDTVLRSHLVEGGNVDTVYNVLQTMLAGETVRLSIDEESSSIVALASPEVQSHIEKTVAEIKASEADFEIIPLKVVDPYFAISLLEEMLDLPDALDDRDENDPNIPKIDADPDNMRLFVRAKRHQIEQIKSIVAGLDETSVASGGADIRVFPIAANQAEIALETVALFWRNSNPIYYYAADSLIVADLVERVVNEDPDAETDKGKKGSIVESEARLLTPNASLDTPAIRCHLTQRGLLLQSDDAEALDEFEDSLRTVTGPADTTPLPPVVFYLQYTRSNDAVHMLAELLDGGETAAESEIGSLINGYVSTGFSGAYQTSIVTSREGTLTMTYGSLTVVADSRLNRLIAQGTSSDIDRLEKYLQIIDKDSSITEIETYGTSHVIELHNTQAEEVAEAIREAFVGRIASDNKSGSQGQPQQNASSQAAREAAARAAAAGQKPGGRPPTGKSSSGDPTSQEPKMTIAVHEPSNSLIVTAPDTLFAQVEKLAREIDERGEQAVEVVVPSSGAVFESVLQQVLLGEQGRSSSSSSSYRRPSYSPPSSSSRYQPRR